jgi:predicted metal-binding protein
MKRIEDLMAKALEAGFDAAGALDCSTIILRPEVREACEKDKCRIIVQTVAKLEDEFDGEGMMEAARRHEQSFRSFSKELRKDYPGMLPLGTESCSSCDRCTYPDAPCREPHGASVPMEACGMMVSDVCRANGMDYYHGKGTLTYTGCFLLE